ncbi:hypothetical protein HCN44_007847 [Aphidius gifuensis]|uniref:RanBD1 domain-containing protein n=1 Tax=Aphidius gifuensis TaxID=684658 RepID=A0A834XLP7_APHGI|nr:nuclear pore complex protein Nup50 [Aphidius gifuensis]XP_044015640.1 nuclear pore complex protein Nup50 [Aphidius gifuensis]XP_044015641.1 nuclear pore complex protein Nup50 [Aphidius gifuensis]KAF7989250.1 hypothetical protein HCN44_007847 [Aphidius gifuensis]
MACKRGATSELNHDNWNCEDEPEEAGTFSTASEEVLKKRVVRTAKRRLPAGESVSKTAFGSFVGFKAAPSAGASPFSFLAKPNRTETSTQILKTSESDKLASNGSTQILENNLLFGTSGASTISSTLSKNEKTESMQMKKNVFKPEEKNMFKQSSDYYAKLKGLNESVALWIKKHVDENPFCILTPIFQDYEKHLNAIEAQHKENGNVSFDNKKSECENSKSLSESISCVKSTVEKQVNFSFKPMNSSKDGNSESTITSAQTHDSKTESAKLTEEDSEKSKTINFPTTSGLSSSFSASKTFSFGGGKPFSFGSGVVTPQNTENQESENKDDDDEPPKPDFKPVTEDGAIFEKRCKVFVKKDGVFGDRGVGVLFLKPTSTDKTQLIVRGNNSLGNLLLNTLLTESIPMKRMNKNTVMLVCIPLPGASPPPTAVLLRVKTSEDADSLYEALDKNKK